MSKTIWFCIGVLTGGVGRPIATHAFYWAAIALLALYKFSACLR